MLDTTADYAGAPVADLCLIFANTRLSDAPAGIAELMAWAAGSVSSPLVDRCRGEAAVFAEAIAVRDLCCRLFAAVASGTTPRLADLRALDVLLRAAPSRTRLLVRDNFFVWHLGLPPAGAAALLAPVLWSAADLLAGARLARVRFCADLQCHRLFLDDSRSANRRWCAIGGCGNRIKVSKPARNP